MRDTQVHIAYRRGVERPAHGLWLDPRDRCGLAFVSHAHSDHIGRHREVILSTGTARLMEVRLPNRNGERREHILPFGEPFELRRVDCHPASISQACIRLFPAGHILGSAQIHFESEEGTLLYSGDFKLRPGLSAELAECPLAETLIMETTFALPRYRFPPTDEILADITRFCDEALDQKQVPILLGYSLGKSQEVVCALLKAGLVPMLHESVFKMTEIYRTAQDGFPSGYTLFEPNEVAGKVLIWPPNAVRSPMIRRIPNRTTAVLTGWAIDSGARYRYGADRAFPLSDHADYDDLLRYVELVCPRRVFTLHGFAGSFAADLRRRGVEAWALGEANQLELAL